MGISSVLRLVPSNELNIISILYCQSRYRTHLSSKRGERYPRFSRLLSKNLLPFSVWFNLSLVAIVEVQEEERNSIRRSSSSQTLPSVSGSGERSVGPRHKGPAKKCN